MFKCPECGDEFDKLICDRDKLEEWYFDGTGYDFASNGIYRSPDCFQCMECGAEIADTEEEAMKFWVKEEAEAIAT